MRPFRFRAQTVLELRRQEEEAVRTALARQRAAVVRLQGLADEAIATARTAAATLAATAAAGATHALLEWHRSWIGKLRRDAAVRLAAVAEAEETTLRLAAALGQATQKRRVLERLRERAWRRYRVDSDREQLREMDRLAGLRHFAQSLELEGDQNGDQSADRHERHDPVPDVQSHAGRERV